MEQRITLVTLGVSDLARAKSFYGALGWRGQEVQETVFFQAGGLGLVLWDRDRLAAECGLEPGPGPGPGSGPGGPGPGGPGTGPATGRAAGFGGIALSHNVRSDTEVDALLAAAERAGARITRPAAVNTVGFRSGAFVDPDGHAWEIAHNPGIPFNEDGSITLPDFGDTPR
ncbi:VOC family protein [Streptomyces sp. NPDC001389]|uniref:VOC family protein n=1 Tax=unclassified Streptomyces TaxID=2593676 RepID=UPI0036CAEDA8